MNYEDLPLTFGFFKGIIPGQSVCTKRVRWGKVAQQGKWE
jgi:hypothetical protein